jgi:hypothetical protein
MLNVNLRTLFRLLAVSCITILVTVLVLFALFGVPPQ